MVHIVVSIAEQTLGLWDDHLCRYDKIYTISTSRNGPGEKKNSYRTPRGHMTIAEKIGAGQKLGTFFVGRRPVNPDTVVDKSKGITTRILWLDGAEPGFNKLGDCDTKERFIYIHGVPIAAPLPRFISQGCINMTDDDVLDLFDRVHTGTPVTVYENKLPSYYVNTKPGNLEEIRNFFPHAPESEWQWMATSTKDQSVMGYIAVDDNNIVDMKTTEAHREVTENQMIETIGYYCMAKGYQALSR
ncbi:MULTISPECIES: L,D-transpeptidase [Candidatus Ichthyocystis]|uniref:Putative L,D-transpeptidase catalytic domain protein n=3 Tax=Candidatus Ichthyocystis TaxID=2929841 RepID=A0A0S4M575_9BURK|nr:MULTISPECIES: L,D-transpeptidase [Ichthyocystis]CUT18050.1 putative L,D-transpeptidase catalytic domain protein [Candidatus Ichthyocystis hellenicum]